MFTYQDYLKLDDDKRYEIVEGELFLLPTPDLYHQRTLGRISMALHEHVREHHLGEIFHAPLDVVLSEINVVQPDILFVSTERAAILTEANIQGAPDLVIEILSPATRQRDLGIKRNLYAKYGVRQYWIVEPDAKTLEVLVWTETGYRSAAVFPQTGVLNSDLFSGLSLDLTDIFDDSWLRKGTDLRG